MIRFMRSRWSLLPTLAALVFVQVASARDVLGNHGIRGAGSTFAQPIIDRWSRDYRAFQARGGDFPVPNGGLEDSLPGTVLDYEPIGSLAGRLKVVRGEVDFAATDVPLTSAELRTAKLVQFPIVVGGIVVAVNVEGVATNQLKFDGALLADIFRGRITRWSDAAIKALNPGIALPDEPIAAIHRSDGSGTTANFTAYLARHSKEWQQTLGVGQLIRWPAGRGAKGNQGVARAIGQTRNSIGYLDFVQAQAARLSLAQLANDARNFVQPSQRSFQVAAAAANWSGGNDFYTRFDGASASDAYPMVSAVFIVVPAQSGDRTQEMLDMFEWALEKGSSSATTLGYVALPPVLVEHIESYWALALRK